MVFLLLVIIKYLGLRIIATTWFIAMILCGYLWNYTFYFMNTDLIYMPSILLIELILAYTLLKLSNLVKLTGTKFTEQKNINL